MMCIPYFEPNYTFQCNFLCLLSSYSNENHVCWVPKVTKRGKQSKPNPCVPKANYIPLACVGSRVGLRWALLAQVGQCCQRDKIVTLGSKPSQGPNTNGFELQNIGFTVVKTHLTPVILAPPLGPIQLYVSIFQ